MLDAENEVAFQLCFRYDGRAQSTYFRALDRLRRLQGDRLRREERTRTRVSKSASFGAGSTGNGPDDGAAALHEQNSCPGSAEPVRKSEQHPEPGHSASGACPTFTHAPAPTPESFAALESGRLSPRSVLTTKTSLLTEGLSRNTIELTSNSVASRSIRIGARRERSRHLRRVHVSTGAQTCRTFAPSNRRGRVALHSRAA
jgi:hypothetical protein